jgi:hypothetical protein
MPEQALLEQRAGEAHGRLIAVVLEPLQHWPGHVVQERRGRAPGQRLVEQVVGGLQPEPAQRALKTQRERIGFRPPGRRLRDGCSRNDREDRRARDESGSPVPGEGP